MGRQVRTLIVDDEDDMRVLLRMTINRANAGLVVAAEAASGSEALDLWRTVQPEVVILDHRMPDMNGLEVAKHMLDELPDQRIILFSAFLEPNVVSAAEQLGIRACMSKSDFAKIPDALWSAVDAA